MLKIRLRHRPRNLSKANPAVGLGPEGRISKMRKLVTALIRHERIEGLTQHIDESRGYAERLIYLASARGPGDPEMMEIADYWLLEKDLIHKLFKVIVPRYEDHQSSFTSLYRLPYKYPMHGSRGSISLLELKKNPYPPVIFKHHNPSGSLINVLLDEDRKDFMKQRFTEYSAERDKQFAEQSLGDEIIDKGQSKSEANATLRDSQINESDRSAGGEGTDVDSLQDHMNDLKVDEKRTSNNVKKHT